MVNQLLLLGFLRSAALFLPVGPKPSVAPPRKKRDSDDEGDGDSDHVDSQGVDASDTRDIPTRGSILVTLRNVPPYTHWSVICYL